MTGPLAGVRVLELPCIGPGPFATMLLADLGADVVRVDRPGGPSLAVVPPEQDLLGRGKRSVALDLKDPADVARCLDLAARADLLVEGFRPGVAERLGVGPAECHARAPRLVYGRMTGWGQEGPYAAQAGHDITYVATAGALGALGPAGGPPTVPLNLVGDFAGALYLVAGLLAALHESRDSGVGQVVDAAMVDGTAHLMTAFHGLLAGGAWLDRPGANLLDGSAPFYGVYRTADDRWLAVGPLEQPFYDEFVARLGLAPEVADRSDPAVWPDLHDLVATVIGSRTPGRLGRGLRRAPTRAWPRSRSLRRGAAGPAPGRPRHVRRAPRGGPAGPGAPLQPHRHRAAPAAAGGRPSTPTRSSPTGCRLS